MKLRNIAYASMVAIASAVIVLGTAGVSEAKGKKKTAAPPPPVFCWGIQKPVCAMKGTQKFTYANACYAAKDGAKNITDGACKPPKAAKKGKPKKAAAAKKPAAKK